MASRTTTTMTPMTWRWRRMSSPSLFPLPSPTTITLTMPSHLVPLELHMDRSLPSPLSSRDMLKTFLGLFILLWFIAGEGSRG